MLAQVTEKATVVASFIQDFWGLIVAALAGIVARFIFTRVIKSYTQELDDIREDLSEIKKSVEKMQHSNFLPRDDANKMVQSVKDEHEKMFREQTKQHEQQREDFKHLVNRIDDVHEQFNEMYKLLVEIKR